MSGMTQSEFKQTAVEVFEELLPNISSGARKRFIAELLSELEDRGLELDFDGDDEEDVEEDE